LRGFGTFVVKKRKERVGRIIATGEIVKIPERKTVVFVPGKALKRV
jgi:nucleoid DNA-binding protein